MSIMLLDVEDNLCATILNRSCSSLLIYFTHSGLVLLVHSGTAILLSFGSHHNRHNKTVPSPLTVITISSKSKPPFLALLPLRGPISPSYSAAAYDAASRLPLIQCTTFSDQTVNCLVCVCVEVLNRRASRCSYKGTRFVASKHSDEGLGQLFSALNLV